MKRFISLIFLLLLTHISFAVTQGPGFFIELAHDLNNEPVEYFDNTKFQSDAYEDYRVEYININLHYNIEMFGTFLLIPFGEIKTWYLMDWKDSLNGKPFCDIYTVGFTIEWAGLSITYDHYCAHPVYSDYDMWQTKDYRMGGNVDEIKIKYAFN